MYYAHSSNKAGGPWEPMEEHLRLVAEMPEDHPDVLGAANQAHYVGLPNKLGLATHLKEVHRPPEEL